MHYTVAFTGSKTEMENQARIATREYLGDLYEKVLSNMELAESAREIVKGVQFACAVFLGVRGYWPVRALTRDALTRWHNTRSA